MDGNFQQLNKPVAIFFENQNKYILNQRINTQTNSFLLPYLYETN